MQHMCFRIRPMPEHALALQTLHQHRARLAGFRRRHFQLHQVRILAAQKPLGDFNQRIRAAAGLNIAHHQRQPFAVRQKRYFHVQPRQRLARRPAVITTSFAIATRTAPILLCAAGWSPAFARWPRPPSGPRTIFTPPPAPTAAIPPRAAPFASFGPPERSRTPVSPARPAVTLAVALVLPAILVPRIRVFRRGPGPCRHKIQIQRKVRFIILRLFLRAGLFVHVHAHFIAGPLARRGPL